MARQEIEHSLKSRLEAEPKLEATSLQAQLSDNSYVVDILPKFRERLIRLNQIYEYSFPKKAGIAEFPSVERVSPIVGQDGDKVGLVGMNIKKLEALVVEAVDPDSEIELFYEHEGVKQTLPSNHGPIKTYKRFIIYDRLKRHQPEHLFVKISPVEKAE